MAMSCQMKKIGLYKIKPNKIFIPRYLAYQNVGWIPNHKAKKKVLDSQATFCKNRWGRQIFFFIPPQNKRGNSFFFLPIQIWP